MKIKYKSQPSKKSQSAHTLRILALIVLLTTAQDAPAPIFTAQDAPAPSLTAQDAPAPSFKDTCVRLLKIFTQNPEFNIARARKVLPKIVAANRETWKKIMALTPESTNGLTTEHVLSALASLRGEWFLTCGIESIGYARHRVMTNFGIPAVVRSSTVRTDYGEGKTATVMTTPRYGVLAFALDRYLGSNVVLPVIFIDGGKTAELYIRARNISINEAQANHSHLVDLTHILMIDILTSNYDRQGKGNLLHETHSNKIIAIDFDLSKPYFRDYGPGQPIDFLIQRALLDPSVYFGRYGPLPGVTSRPVYEKLVALDRATLVSLTAKHDLILTENEIGNILSSRQQLLNSINIWTQIYGESNILID